MTTKYWDDVQEGEELPGVNMLVTTTTCVFDAAATRDYFPGHHDREYAKNQNVRDAYLNTMFYHGFIDRVATDWAGPEAFLRRRKMKMVNPICIGDTIKTQSRVKKHYEKEGAGLVDVDVELHTEEGQCVTAALTLELPRKA